MSSPIDPLSDAHEALTFHPLPKSSETMITKDTNPKDAIADNKLPLWLVSPIVKSYQAIAHFLGNVKYGAWNYRAAGARASVYYSAANRHLDAWFEGEDNDPVDGTPHLANALACINILIEAKHSKNLLDDRPPSRIAELAKIRADFEALMPRIRARYAHLSPKHYSIKDSAPAPAPQPAPSPFPPIPFISDALDRGKFPLPPKAFAAGIALDSGEFISAAEINAGDYTQRRRDLAGDQS